MISFSEKWYGNSWKDVELVLYADTVLAWHDEVSCISVSVFQVYVLLKEILYSFTPGRRDGGGRQAGQLA